MQLDPALPPSPQDPPTPATPPSLELEAPPLPPLDLAPLPECIDLSAEELVTGLIQAHFLAGRRLLGTLRPGT